MTSLDFDATFNYEDADAGILVPIRLIRDNRSVELKARLDTGAADCLFDRHYADVLGLPEIGVERYYRTITGVVETLGLRWSAVVYFHAIGNPAFAFVGRRGWLDRVRLGIEHSRRTLFLGR